MAKEPTKTDAPAASAARTVYELSEPVEFSGETVREVCFRRATARDIRMHWNNKAPTGDRYVAFLVNITEKPAAFFDLIPPGDFVALTDIVDGFFKRPGSAETSTP